MKINSFCILIISSILTCVPIAQAAIDNAEILDTTSTDHLKDGMEIFKDGEDLLKEGEKIFKEGEKILKDGAEELIEKGSDLVKDLPLSSFIVPDGKTATTAIADAVSTIPGLSEIAASIATPTVTEEGVAYNEVSRRPPCAGISSTCITNQTIFNAKHGYVQDSPVKTYISLQLPPDGEELECQTPTKTGATVHRQVVRKLWKYNDAFCINQGCVYMGTASGSLKCQ